MRFPKTRKKPKVLIALNSAWNLVNFRSGLIRALVFSGYEVVATAPLDEYASSVVGLGCHFIPLRLDKKGTHPGRDLLLLWRFYKLLRRQQPEIYLSYTIKPNIYGSLAAHLLRIPVINNVAGLGIVFATETMLTRLVRGLYRLVLSRSAKVFFQNGDDRKMFVAGGLVPHSVAECLPGSGIDLAKFSPLPFTRRGKVRFLLIARMLWDKGIGEYVEAARILKTRSVNADFALLGFLDVENPNAISRKQMETWTEEGVVHYLGVSDDVRIEIAAADCVVLPSYYREGTPRALLEAAAMGRPIITTDSVGCREVVDDGVNGYLCRPRDAYDLADKMARIEKLSIGELELMGTSGRKKMESEFDERIVINKYLEEIASVLKQQKRL